MPPATALSSASRARCVSPSGAEIVKRGLSFSLHGVIQGETAQRLSIARIDAQFFFSQRDSPAIGPRGFGASPRGPVVRVSQISPQLIILFVQLHSFFEVLCRLGIVPHLKIGSGKVRTGVGCRPDAQRLFEKRDGFGVSALQNADAAKVVVTGKTIRGE